MSIINFAHTQEHKIKTRTPQKKYIHAALCALMCQHNICPRGHKRFCGEWTRVDFRTSLFCSRSASWKRCSLVVDLCAMHSGSPEIGMHWLVCHKQSHILNIYTKHIATNPPASLSGCHLHHWFVLSRSQHNKYMLYMKNSMQNRPKIVNYSFFFTNTNLVMFFLIT